MIVHHSSARDVLWRALDKTTIQDPLMLTGLLSKLIYLHVRGSPTPVKETAVRLLGCKSKHDLNLFSETSENGYHRMSTNHYQFELHGVEVFTRSYPSRNLRSLLH
jgi:hypothetical protein